MLLLAIVLAGIGSCQQASSVAPLSIGAEPGDFYGVAWLQGGELVVGRTVGARDDPRLAIVDPLDGSMTDVRAPPEPKCWRERFFSPTGMADGRLAFVHVCMRAVNGDPPDEVEIRAIDLSSDTVRRLFRIGPVGVSQNVQFAIGPDFEEAIVGIGAGACGRLVRFEPDGTPSLIEAEVADGDKRFSLADPFDLARCLETGIASSPTLSAAGRRLAFLASPASVGLTAEDRLDAPANIYVLELDDGAPSKIASDIVHGGELQWSPDGRQVAFAGEVGGVDGTWLVDMAGSVRQIAGPARRLAWSPDGRRLLASVLLGVSDDPLAARLELIAVP